MIATLVKPMFCWRILWKRHHTQQTILQHVLQTHDSLPYPDDVGHLACFWANVIIVVSDDVNAD